VLPSPATDESKADQVLGRPSVISVYVPSVPGIQAPYEHVWAQLTQGKAPASGSILALMMKRPEDLNGIISSFS
jgi:hypothetical protein